MNGKNMRTPLGRARGLGSAKDGVHHWWMQRLTAVALVPLCLWFAASLVSVAGADHAATVAWIGSPLVAILLILLVVAGFYHAALGLRVVIEDYVGSEAVKQVALVLVQFACIALGVATVFSILKLAL